MSPLVLCVIALASVPKMEQEPMQPIERYKSESAIKQSGAIFTPHHMAHRLSIEMLDAYRGKIPNKISVLDPAVGDGELLVSFVEEVKSRRPTTKIKVTGFDINVASCENAKRNLQSKFKDIEVEIRNEDFLSQIEQSLDKYDFVIANPPYIRTQILGSRLAQEMAAKYGLSGRVDIYYSFLVNTGSVLQENGIAGYITSNKFLSIKSGSPVRKFMLENYEILSLTDYGDTKVFENAAVLPSTIVFGQGCTTNCSSVKFVSIYEAKDDGTAKPCQDIYEHLGEEGLFKLPDDRVFVFRRGVLGDVTPGGVWSLSNEETRGWLDKVEAHTWLHFSDLGKIRVGIKTTADNVFIGENWGASGEQPELLKSLVTHRDAGKITPDTNCNWKVLYPHYSSNGKRSVVDIEEYPKSKRYLEKHRPQLVGRKYVIEAGRRWYEIWVPQNPASWSHRKIVFRDISETPQFWYDNTGSVVNGDCYWIDIDSSVSDDLVYLALAVANSSFIEKYYDVRFNTKLYSGKRRFMTQFVEQFPLPSTNSVQSVKAISLVKSIIDSNRHATKDDMRKLNDLVNEMFMVD